MPIFEPAHWHYIASLHAKFGYPVISLSQDIVDRKFMDSPIHLLTIIAVQALLAQGISPASAGNNVPVSVYYHWKRQTVWGEVTSCQLIVAMVQLEDIHLIKYPHNWIEKYRMVKSTSLFSWYNETIMDKVNDKILPISFKNQPKSILYKLHPSNKKNQHHNCAVSSVPITKDKIQNCKWHH